MNYPIFKTHYNSFYKFLSDNLYLEIQTDNLIGGAQLGVYNVPSNHEMVMNEGDAIPENTFIDAYVRALHDIHKEVNPEGLEITVNHQLSPGLEIY